MPGCVGVRDFDVAYEFFNCLIYFLLDDAPNLILRANAKRIANPSDSACGTRHSDRQVPNNLNGFTEFDRCSHRAPRRETVFRRPIDTNLNGKTPIGGFSKQIDGIEFSLNSFSEFRLQ